MEATETWSLTFDLKHDPGENLLSAPLQRVIINLLTRNAFVAMACGPVCASFSTAVTPPVRTTEYPEGVPWCSELQQRKNIDGNNMLDFVLRAVRVAIIHHVKFFVENPDGSWLWKQRGRLSWDFANRTGKLTDFRIDYCRLGTEWRKRTKFRTNLHIGGQNVMCRCGRRHLQLRGRCREKGCNYTHLAEAYPRKLCEILAAAFCNRLRILGRLSTFRSGSLCETFCIAGRRSEKSWS